MENQIFNENCLDTMRRMPNEYIDLIITSPPYDDLRTYDDKYDFQFENVAHEIARILKIGGVCVWIVGDATKNGSETGTSFRQALFFMDVCGLKLHDTMIWNKMGFSAVGSLRSRYAPVFEYMFVFSKGKPAIFNPIKDRSNKNAGRISGGTIRNADGTTKPMSKKMIIADYGQRFNIWEQSPVRQRGGHPAPFPEKLAQDHIASWSNRDHIVYDPFLGSGTTCVAAKALKRRYIGSEMNDSYFKMAKERIENTPYQGDLFEQE